MSGQVSVNRVDFSGEVSEPVLRQTGTGKDVCNFTLILTDKFKGDKPVRQYIRAVSWQGQAKRVSEMKDGTKVRIRGRMETASWQDKQNPGKWIHKLQVVCSEVEEIPHLQATPDQATIDQRPIDDSDIPF
jgi:single-stranded DNA-binding protein